MVIFDQLRKIPVDLTVGDTGYGKDRMRYGVLNVLNTILTVPFHIRLRVAVSSGPVCLITWRHSVVSLHDGCLHLAARCSIPFGAFEASGG